MNNKRISYERRDWNVVQVFAMLNESTALDDVLPLIIRYPDSIQGNGPMIDVHRKRGYSLVSASKWRAWNRGYLLDTQGEIITGDPYKTKRGKWAVRNGKNPQTARYHPHAIRIGDDRNPQWDKIPVLTYNQLVALLYDDSMVGRNTFKQRRR